MGVSGEESRAPLGDGTSVRYRTRGSGPPILLVRPLGGSIALWSAFETALSERLRVVSFDARGSGASSPLRGPTTTRRMAADARAVLDHAGIPRTSVFGQSLGGMVATWLAVDAPARVDALVLASTALEGFEFSHAGLLRGAGFARCLARSRSGVEVCLAERVLSPAFKAANAARVAEINAALRSEPTPRRTLALHALAGALHSASDVARRMKTRTLCLAGESDELLGLEPQRALARAIEGSRFESLRGIGHDLTLEAPSESAARVLAFVESR